MVNSIQEDEVLKQRLSNTSKTARWRLTTYVVAVAHWLLQVLFDEHKKEVDSKLATQRAHNQYWYAAKAKAFQYGHALVPEKDYYKTIDEKTMVVSHAAVDEINGKLFIKVAKDNGSSLMPLTEELDAFIQYLQRVKDAGVKITVISEQGDDLRLVMDIWYDPQLLNEDGSLIRDPSRFPARDTINRFISRLPFNGEFVPTLLVDALQETEGIAYPEILSVETRYAANDWSAVHGKEVPNAGYLTIKDENLTINYKANV